MYFYNSDNTIDRIEKYRKDELFDIEKYIYDSSKKAIKRLIIAPQTYEVLCGDRDTIDCLPRFGDRIYSYDNLLQAYYIIFDEDTITKPIIDSIFQDSKLVTVLSGSDTLHTYLYNKNGRLVTRFNYSICSKKLSSWTKFDFNEQITIEYEYSPKSKRKPYMTTELVYNSKHQLIKKTRTYKFSGRRQPVNNYIIEKYSYIDDRIIVYESYDNYIDPCFNMYCCGRYKKYFEYEE